MRIRYYEEALEEILESIDFYTEKEPVLGAYFYNDIQETVTVLKRFPTSGKKIPEYPHLRTFACKRFPYSLIYHIESEDRIIFIVAVAHNKRKPDYWKNRF